jgi:hypothetical protein
MLWTVLFHEAFDLEFRALKEGLQDELLAHAKLLQEFGPQLGRPTVDTLKGSKHANMKELRFEWQREVWARGFRIRPEAASRSPRGRRQGRGGSKAFLSEADQHRGSPIGRIPGRFEDGGER